MFNQYFFDLSQVLLKQNVKPHVMEEEYCYNCSLFAQINDTIFKNITKNETINKFYFYQVNILYISISLTVFISPLLNISLSWEEKQQLYHVIVQFNYNPYSKFFLFRYIPDLHKKDRFYALENICNYLLNSRPRSKMV